MSMKKDSPYIDPAVASNPAAMKYQQSVLERMKQSQPRVGPPTPIPRLDSQHVEGMTMADQAMAQRLREQQNAAPQGGVVMHSTNNPPTNTVHRGLLNNDLLPDAAKDDPSYIQGQGAMFAINQPLLAQKYGVIRNGQFIPPQALSSGRGGLKPTTVEGLKALQEFQNKRQHAESSDAVAENGAKDGMGGAAARIANPSGSDDVSASESVDKDLIKRAMNNMDEYDFNTLREAMFKDLLNNDEQRKIVEERLTPLDVNELIINGYITQRVPIIPGAYEPEFRSYTAEEDLALKRLLMEEKKGLDIPDRYLLDKYSFMTITIGLQSINKKPFPDCWNQEGKFDSQLFWAKFNRVMKLPFHMLASLGVHYYWFDIRVRKLFVAEKLKNG